MFSPLLKLFDLPESPEGEDTRRGRLLNVILWASMILAIVIGLASPLTEIPSAYAIAAGLMFVTAMVGHVLLRRGKSQLAGILFLSAAWSIVLMPSFIGGGLSSPAPLFTVLVIMAAGLLLGERAAGGFVLVSILAYSILLYAEIYHLLPASEQGVSPFRYWLIAVLTFLFMEVLLRLSVRDMNSALAQSRITTQQLQETNQELEHNRETLELRVEERTADLQRRATQLQAAAEVGRAASTLRDLDQLLNEVVRLISERFGFYHVGIFLLNESGEIAVLRAANSEGGRQMLAKSYFLKVGEAGIVGYVTKTREPRIALDVGTDAIHFKNPFLPNTRSEMALPLVVSEHLLGALDIQSTVEAAFTEDDVAVLQVLSGQVAVAIENVRLLNETQAALEVTRRAYGELSRQAWLEKLRGAPIGFRRDMNGITFFSDSELPAVQLLPSENSAHALTIPIKVRGQTIGLINAHKSPSATDWNPAETTLLNTLTEQLGVALDSARLYEETQERAERERVISEITSHFRQTLDLDAVLQTAVREIYQALDLADITIKLGQDGNRSVRSAPIE